MSTKITLVFNDDFTALEAGSEANGHIFQSSPGGNPPRGKQLGERIVLVTTKGSTCHWVQVHGMWYQVCY